MPDTIDISGLNKADVLAALYNAASCLGLGFLHFTPEPMSREEAEALLERQEYFDYVKGRVMKVRINGDTLYTGLYDRDNGQGAAQRALAHLRTSV